MSYTQIDLVGSYWGKNLKLSDAKQTVRYYLKELHPSSKTMTVRHIEFWHNAKNSLSKLTEESWDQYAIKKKNWFERAFIVKLTGSYPIYIPCTMNCVL